MADPISIVTGVVGLIKASCDITKLLTNIIGSVKDAPAQAAFAVADISETRTILSQLQNFLLRFETADKSRTALVQVDQLVDVISGCVATFSEFEAVLDKIAGSDMTLAGRAKWALWDEEKISCLLARLQRHKSSLSLLVIVLTGETQLEILDSIKMLRVAADASPADTLKRPQLQDNESVTSRMTTGSQASSSTDTDSIVTILHSPRDLELVPGNQYHYAFEPDLKESRPYRRVDLKATTSTTSLTEIDIRGWSVLSGYSLADVSNISVLSLNISISELCNPDHYDLSGKHFTPVGEKPLESEILQQQALQGKAKASRLKHTWSLGTVNFRATFYKNQGRLVDAEHMYRRVLDVNERMLGPEHKSTLATVFELGLLCEKQSKLVEASAMYQRILAGREKALGPEHESTLDTVHRLGVVYYKQDKLVEAEALHRRALAGMEKVRGPDDMSTLNSIHMLGCVYGKQLKPVEAVAMFQRTLAGKEKLLGPEHESTLNTAHNLGMIYYNQDKLLEAEAMFKRALAGRAIVMGSQHKLTLNVVHNLGGVYEKNDRLAKAEATYQQALAGREKTLGTEHESTIDTVQRLGVVYYKQDKLVDAEAMFQRALGGYTNILGPEHQSTRGMINLLGSLYRKQEKIEEAEALEQRAIPSS